jgi:endo-1,4-beta-xylanase
MERKMKIISKSVIFAATTAATLMLVPLMASAATICNNTQGGSSPNFYTNYIYNGTGCINTKNGGGAYSTSWNVKSGGNYVAGKGWSTGSAGRKIGYNAGAFSQDGTNWLGVYGWTKNPLIEYYVIDAWGDWRPNYGASLGTVTTDGGTYDIYKADKINADNITGVKQNFTQFFSVRRTKTRVDANAANNLITFGNHVNAWKNKGLNLGTTWDYQVLVTEAYGGGGKLSGYSDVTVWSQ